MNHIYKIIWNQAKHCYTVVSEIAKNHKQGTKSKKSASIATVLAVSALLGCMPFVSAASDTIHGETESTKIGFEHNTSLKNSSLVIDSEKSQNTSSSKDSNDKTVEVSVYAETDSDPAIVFDQDKTSLKSTNAKNVYKNSIALGKEAEADTENTIAIGNGAHATGNPTGHNGVAIGNNSSAGCKGISLGHGATSAREGTIIIGDSANSQGLYTTVVGANSQLTIDYTPYKYNFLDIYKKDVYVQGALSTSFGAKNTMTNDNKEVYSGIANSIVGSANKIKNSNGVTIQGTGNTVTNAYKDMDITNSDISKILGGNYSSLAEKDSGAIAVIGGANTISDQTSSTVIGFGNTLTGDSSTGTAGVFTAGSHNTLTNVSNSLIMGDWNKLKNLAGVISLGNKNTIEADDAVAIGHGAKVTAKSGLALGTGSVSDREIDSIDSVGYLANGATDMVWKATGGAVSIGSSSITRQLINVAAGTRDTDAVNVAQLKKALESIDIDIGAGTGIKIDKITKDGKTTYKISANIEGSKTDTDTTTVTSKTDTPSTDTSQEKAEGPSTSTGDKLTIGTVTNPTSFGADDKNKADIKPGETLNINGDEKNISTSVNGNSIQVKLNDEIDVKKVTAETVNVGNTTITTDGLTIQGGPSITQTGIDGGNQKVTGVAAGEISSTSTDAVNGSQLFATNQQLAQNTQSISKLGNRINKVGAGAAALAALHPLDFDPDDKWDFAAGYGNYNGENAVALGAYYRPNEDTMFSVGGSFGNGENMVNAGVSLKLGQGNHVSTSKVAMAKEIKDLRKELEVLKSALLDMHAGKKMDTSKLQLFPDVPKNHWAYEYVATLKGNGMLTGYPDGDFKGDRCMTRYEFATMLYNAMLEGATLPEQMLQEFAPELERFTVDTVHQDKQGKPTVERVRTVKADA